VTRGKQGLFLRIEEFSRRRYRLVFLVTTLVVLASTWLSSRLTLDGDVPEPRARQRRVVNTLQGRRSKSSAVSTTCSSCSRPGTARPRGSPGVRRSGGANLQNRSDRSPLRRAQVDTSGPFFSFFRENQILFLPPSKLPELQAKFGERR